jgi:hypothetical protein
MVLINEVDVIETINDLKILCPVSENDKIIINNSIFHLNQLLEFYRDNKPRNQKYHSCDIPGRMSCGNPEGDWYYGIEEEQIYNYE